MRGHRLGQLGNDLRRFAKEAWREGWHILLAFSSAVLAFLGVFAGLWFSLYAEEAKKTLPPLLEKYKPTFEKVDFGWLLLVGFLLLAVILQLIRHFQNKRARDELYGEAQQLRSAVEALRSLPPEGYLQMYHDLVATCPRYYEVGFSDDCLSKAELELAVRKVLSCVARLAHRYTSSADAGTSARVGANVMIALTPSKIRELEDGERKEIIANLRFCSKEAKDNPEQHRLVLQLRPELSGTSDDGADGQIDAAVPALCMPVPHEYKQDFGPQIGEKWRVLPGAPFAAATRRFAYFGSIGGKNGLLEWCDDDADLCLAAREEIKAYFGKKGLGDGIKSFVSVPLVLHVPASEQVGGDWEHWPEADGRAGLLIGVNRPGLSGGFRV